MGAIQALIKVNDTFKDKKAKTIWFSVDKEANDENEPAKTESLMSHGARLVKRKDVVENEKEVKAREAEKRWER